MAKLVCATAAIQCTFGSATSMLNVLPTGRVMVEGKPAATIMDAIPMTNILTFGTCSSLANPTVASATTAAQGVLTPMPCIPVTVAWTPPATKAMIGGKPALLDTAKCNCSWGGLISINVPGSAKSNGT